MKLKRRLIDLLVTSNPKVVKAGSKNYDSSTIFFSQLKNSLPNVLLINEGFFHSGMSIESV